MTLDISWVELRRLRGPVRSDVTNGVCFQRGEWTRVLSSHVTVNGKPLYLYTVHLHSAPHSGPFSNSVLQDPGSELSREAVLEACNAQVSRVDFLTLTV